VFLVRFLLILQKELALGAVSLASPAPHGAPLSLASWGSSSKEKYLNSIFIAPIAPPIQFVFISYP